MPFTPEHAEHMLSQRSAEEISRAVALLAVLTPGTSYMAAPLRDQLLARLQARGATSDNIRKLNAGMVHIADRVMIEEDAEYKVELTGHHTKGIITGDWRAHITARLLDVPANAATDAAIVALSTLDPEALKPILSRLVDKTEITYITDPLDPHGERPDGSVLLASGLHTLIDAGEAINLGIHLMRPGHDEGVLVQVSMERLSVGAAPEPEDHTP